MVRRIVVVLVVLGLSIVVRAQEIPRPASTEESQLSRILKSAGTLLVRERHDLNNLPTSLGQDVECEILIVRNLLANDIGTNDTAVGLVLKAKEKYGTKSTYIDPDEIDALLASLELVEKDGMELTGTPQASPPGATSHSIEIHYRTKDGMVLGVYQSKGELQYAVKLSPTADYAFLKTVAVSVFKENLKVAKQVADQVLQP